jgi:hypothetical protein
MTTARQIIQRALQKNGVLTKGESPDGDEASDGLSSLNDMIASWSNDSLLIYARLSESFPLVSGQASYTIGTGGNFNTARPLQILTAFTRIGDIDYNISIIPEEAFDGIAQKNISSSIPDVLFYSAGFPLGTITIYPVPATGVLHIRSEKQLSSLPTLDTDIELPPGWKRALIFNLALELASEYGQQVDQATYQIAMSALNKIKTAVARNKKMDMYPYNGSNNNVYSGWHT